MEVLMTAPLDHPLATLPEHSVALALAAPPPLIAGEDAAAYDDLLARIAGAVKPADILEDIWVHDVVDLVWDVVRLRRMDRMTMAAEARRSALLREIDRHRASFARTLRRAAQEVEDAEFKMIAPPDAAEGAA